MSLASKFDEMKARFDSEAAGDLSAVFQYDIDGNHWSVSIDNGECTIAEGEHEDADVTLTLDEETFAGILSGEIDGMQAFMAGDVKADGNIMLAPQIEQIFPQNS